MTKKIKFYKQDMIEYEILNLVDFYDDILRQPTSPWDFSTKTPKEAQFLAFSMAETLGELGGLWNFTDKRYEIDGKKLYAKDILKNIEKYFPPEVMEKLDVIAKGNFSYGA